MIGRKKETETLNRLYNSSKSQFVAVYGRKRVGKTYLVNETFSGKITFRHAGLSPLEYEQKKTSNPLQQQLRHFYNSLIVQGMKRSRCPDKMILFISFLNPIILSCPWTVSLYPVVQANTKAAIRHIGLNRFQDAEMSRVG